jgi:hypothetical protein
MPLNWKLTTDLMIQVRAVLLCVSCDMPASREMCGYLSCGARKGCPRCEKVFTRVDNENNPYFPKGQYGGYGEEQMRTDDNVRATHRRLLNAKNKTQRAKIEKETGVKWCELARLPYLDFVRFGTLDWMHNGHLGTGKALNYIFMDLPLRDCPLLHDNPYARGSIFEVRTAKADAASLAASVPSSSSSRATDRKRKSTSGLPLSFP